ncbi:hypothetical protein GOODEAATRI_008620 [Goodea atripinnis]|uniref:Uncharacterized protein n=1 Tax=Goodea atripinnis TaxID=208336 RepID=A0ABV0NSX6_9TELE
MMIFCYRYRHAEQNLPDVPSKQAYDLIYSSALAAIHPPYRPSATFSAALLSSPDCCSTSLHPLEEQPDTSVTEVQQQTCAAGSQVEVPVQNQQKIPSRASTCCWLMHRVGDDAFNEGKQSDFSVSDLLITDLVLISGRLNPGAHGTDPFGF